MPDLDISILRSGRQSSLHFGKTSRLSFRITYPMTKPSLPHIEPCARSLTHQPGFGSLHLLRIVLSSAFEPPGPPHHGGAGLKLNLGHAWLEEGENHTKRPIAFNPYWIKGFPSCG